MKFKTQEKEITINVAPEISLCSMVFIVFLVLKLCSVITWSWWFITMPLWGGIALTLGVVGVILIGLLLLFSFVFLIGLFIGLFK